MSTDQMRYKIAAKSAPEFSDEFFVECPKCHGCALLIPMGEGSVGEQSSRDQANGDEAFPDHTSQAPQVALNPKHLECFDCAFRRTWNPIKPSFFRSLVNWFGELSLYMQVDCGDQTIWALNPKHLEYLQEQLRLCAEGKAEASAPMQEWLEHHGHTEIATCLTRLKREPANV
jgi:hypothetical protein